MSGQIERSTAWPVAASGSQPLDADLTAIAALSTTSYGRSLLTAADAAAARTLIGLELGLTTMYVPASALIANTTNGAAPGVVEVASNLVMLVTKDFDASTAESAQFAVQMPVSWDEGTITAAFVWKHAATTTNFGVAWDIAGVALSDGDDPVAFGTAVVVTDTGGTTNRIYITATSSAVTIAGTPAAGDWVVFRVRRAPANAADTMAIDAGLIGVSVFFTINALKDG